MEKFIAIDVGHGEAASAYVAEKLDDDKISYDVKRLVFDKSVPTVYSRIFITEEQMKKLSSIGNELTYSKLCDMGPFLIGNFEEQFGRPGETFQYFKVKPSKFNDPIIQGEYTIKYPITHRMVMSCYIYQLVNEIFENNPHDIADYTRSNTTIIVGCPTSEEWTSPQNINSYRDLIANATGVKNALVVAESRAAMFSSIQYNNKSVSADNGAIIFDFGSSTADCTYMWMGKGIWEFSWRLGASSIETELYSYLIQDYNTSNPDSPITSEQIINSVGESTRILRGKKEEFYKNDTPFRATLEFDGTDNTSDRSIRKIVDKDIMDLIIKNRQISFTTDVNEIKSGSWYDLCREFFEYAKNTIVGMSVNGENCPITSISITGGASKMPFITELCKSVFTDVTDDNVFVEPVPSYSVSNGLCWIQITDDKVEECAAKINNVINGEGVFSTDALVNTISKDLSNSIIDVILNRAKGWAASDTDLSVQDLVDSVSQDIKDPKIAERFKNIIISSEKRWSKKCSNKINKAVKKEAKNLYCNNVPKFITNMLNNQDDSLQNISIDFDPILNAITSYLGNSVVTVIVSIIVFIVGLLISLTGWGLIIGGPMMLLSDEIANDIVNGRKSSVNGMTTPRSKSKRESLLNALTKRLNGNNNDIVPKLKESIRKSLEENTSINDAQIVEDANITARKALETLLLKNLKKIEE